MPKPDLNLLVTLDVLLTEGSVARAARRLRLSPSAMSRALARLRQTTGDPLLVRAGRGLVPTPRALKLREDVGRIVREAEAALRPADQLDLARLQRTFTLRTSDGFVENFGPDLIARLHREAPDARLHFIVKSDKDSAALRSGDVDLETGVVGEETDPGLRTQALFRDRFIGVACKGHALSKGRVTAKRYAAARHVLVSRRGLDRGLADEALEPLGLTRKVAVDLVAAVPEFHTAALRSGLHNFLLPVPLPQITVSLIWHPRMDADPAHRWLRSCLREICAGVRGHPAPP